MKCLPVCLSIFGSLLLPAVSTAHEAGEFLVRVGATSVNPDAGSSPLALNGTMLSLSGANSTLDVDNNTQLGLNLAYMLSDNWAVEVLAATPFKHTASGRGELAGLDIVDTKQLPPTLSLLWYPSTGSNLSPYVGAGLNYTVFFDESVTGAAAATLATLGLTGGDASLDSSFGLSYQAGFDLHLNDTWFVNASIRWIDIDSDAVINFNGGSRLTADVEIDPFVYTISIGRSF
jgi:outer membrane protein